MLNFRIVRLHMLIFLFFLFGLCFLSPFSNDDHQKKVEHPLQSDQEKHDEVKEVVLEYLVDVDYDRSWIQAVKSGGYDRLHGYMKSFELIKETYEKGKKKARFLLYRFGDTPCPITSQEVIQKIEKNGHRVATLLEILALGETYPDLQRKYIINTPNVFWDEFPNRRGYAILASDDDGGRVLSLGWMRGHWAGEAYLFVAVKP